MFKMMSACSDVGSANILHLLAQRFDNLKLKLSIAYCSPLIIIFKYQWKVYCWLVYSTFQDYRSKLLGLSMTTVSVQRPPALCQ